MCLGVGPCQKKSKRNLYGVLFAAIFCANVSWATVTACGVGAVNEVALSTYTTAPLTGCTAVDVSFESFVVTSTTNTGGFGVPATTSTAGYVTGASSTSGSTVGAINFLQSAVNATDWTGGVGNAQFIAKFDYVATAHT